MLALVLTLALAPPPTDAASEGVRAVTVAVYTKKNAPVEDLEPAEVTVKENGEKKPVLALERDERPLEVALVLDSSHAMGSEYRATLVAAALEFWKALPPEAAVSVWTSGGAPSRVVDFGTGAAAAETALQQVAAGGKNFTLDTIVDASRHLGQRRAERRALVVVTNTDVEASRTLIQKAYTAAAQARVTPMILLVRAGGAPAQTWDVETVFERMSDAYGGAYDVVLTPLATRKLLARIAADLRGQYQLRYVSGGVETSNPEVKVDRKGVAVRVGLSRPER